MQQSFEEIKKNHPDEWLILGDPVMSDDGQRILTAELLYHSSDKRELARMDKPLMKQYKRHAYRYNCVTPRKQSVMVSVRLMHPLKAITEHRPIKSIYAQ